LEIIQAEALRKLLFAQHIVGEQVLQRADLFLDAVLDEKPAARAGVIS
jgi:hypothetical protein